MPCYVVNKTALKSVVQIQCESSLQQVEIVGLQVNQKPKLSFLHFFIILIN